MARSASRNAPSKRQSKRERAEARRRAAIRRQRITAAVAVGAVVVVAVVIFASFGGVEAPAGSTEREAWDLPALDGEGRVALADFEGKPTVAAFFASWCHICQRELPGFAVLSDRVGDEVNWVGINTMNNGTGLGFARQMGIGDWVLARDIGGVDGRELAVNFGARGSPTTVLYDSEGNVVDVTLGGMTADQLAAKLETFFGISA